MTCPSSPWHWNNSPTFFMTVRRKTRSQIWYSRHEDASPFRWSVSFVWSVWLNKTNWINQRHEMDLRDINRTLCGLLSTPDVIGCTPNSESNSLDFYFPFRRRPCHNCMACVGLELSPCPWLLSRCMRLVLNDSIRMATSRYCGASRRSHRYASKASGMRSSDSNVLPKR